VSELNKERIGEELIDKYGCTMKIVEYNAYNDIVVEFQDDHKYKTKARYDVFLDKRIKNIYRRNHYGVAYTGEISATDSNGKKKVSYTVWGDMIRRCYSDKSLIKNPTYKGCTVCDEWLCYENFERWYNSNFYEVANEIMNLDKDILVKGNKIYSPNTCVFVPDRINRLFLKSNSIRGSSPIGVSYNKSKRKYEVMCGGKSFGTYVDELFAFSVYKLNKEIQIKEVADKYKEKIPKNLYEAMYKYEVEITD